MNITTEYLASQGLSETFPKRFWEKVQKADGCWIWTGSVNDRIFPYGCIGAGGKHGITILAHRASWIMHNGPIPEGMHVLHNCPTRDNPRCVNPSHLWLGKDLENQRDSVKKGTHHSFQSGDTAGESNWASKLTWEKVDEIRNKFTGQYGQLSQLGREYGVTFHAIRLIVLGKRWKVVHNIRQ